MQVARLEILLFFKTSESEIQISVASPAAAWTRRCYHHLTARLFT